MLSTYWALSKCQPLSSWLGYQGHSRCSRFFRNLLRVLQLPVRLGRVGKSRLSRNDARVCLLVLPWDEVRALEQLPFPVLNRHGLSLDVAV